MFHEVLLQPEMKPIRMHVTGINSDTVKHLQHTTRWYISCDQRGQTDRHNVYNLTKPVAELEKRRGGAEVKC